MPYKPSKPCRHPGCARLVASGKYCEEHLPLHPEYIRSAAARGYSTRWNKARKAYLAEHPLCAECLRHGKYTTATVVDHIRPHRGNDELFWNENNWQALCKPCHDRKTGKHDSKPTYGYGFV